MWAAGPAGSCTATTLIPTGGWPQSTDEEARKTKNHSGETPLRRKKENEIKEELSTSPRRLIFKSDQGLARAFDIPQTPHELQLLFPVTLSQDKNQPAYANPDFDTITAFKKARVRDFP